MIAGPVAGRVGAGDFALPRRSLGGVHHERHRRALVDLLSVEGRVKRVAVQRESGDQDGGGDSVMRGGASARGPRGVGVARVRERRDGDVVTFELRDDFGRGELGIRLDGGARIVEEEFSLARAHVEFPRAADEHDVRIDLLILDDVEPAEPLEQCNDVAGRKLAELRRAEGDIRLRGVGREVDRGNLIHACVSVRSRRPAGCGNRAGNCRSRGCRHRFCDRCR